LSNPGAVAQTQNVGHVPNMSYTAFGNYLYIKWGRL
jgi:hypothetical protein